MARVRAYSSIDMTDRSRQIGDVSYADKKLFVVSTFDEDAYYIGRFSYDNGQWEGRITGIEYYNPFLHYEVKRIDIDTKFAQVGSSINKAYRLVLGGDDSIYGSSQGDILIGLRGNDKILGKNGNDKLVGGAGADFLSGGHGSDKIKGGNGSDVILAGNGKDLISGGRGRDTFVFEDSDGTNLITDYRKSHDTIEITRGARSIDDLMIERDGDDVIVSFANTEIIFEDTKFHAVVDGDFLFS